MAKIEPMNVEWEAFIIPFITSMGANSVCGIGLGSELSSPRFQDFVIEKEIQVVNDLTDLQALVDILIVNIAPLQKDGPGTISPDTFSALKILRPDSAVVLIETQPDNIQDMENSWNISSVIEKFIAGKYAATHPIASNKYYNELYLEGTAAIEALESAMAIFRILAKTFGECRDAGVHSIRFTKNLLAIMSTKRVTVELAYNLQSISSAERLSALAAKIAAQTAADNSDVTRIKRALVQTVLEEASVNTDIRNADEYIEELEMMLRLPKR